MKVALTGCSGKVGSVVAADLIEHGIEVVGIGRRLAPDLKFTKALSGYRHTDLTNPFEAFSSLNDTDTLIHFAATPTPPGDSNEKIFSNNVLSTYNLLEAATAHSIKRVIIASSNAILGTAYAWLYPGKIIPIHYFPIDEKHLLSPLDAYSLSKQVNEFTCAAFANRADMTIIALRFAAATMPSDYANIARQADYPNRSFNLLWSYTDIRDVAQAVRLSLIANLNGFHEFYITANDTISNRESKDLIKEFYPNVTMIGESISERASLFSFTKAHNLLGYTPQYQWKQYEV